LKRFAVLVVLTVTVGALPTGAEATPLSAFHTPKWAAACFVTGPAEGRLSAGSLVCVRPRDGFTITIGSRGDPEWRYERWARGFRDPFTAARLLRFDQHWAVRPFWHCVSRRTGVTCWNEVGHGWRLGRYSYRTF
jgi:hypothetical protein